MKIRNALDEIIWALVFSLEDGCFAIAVSTLAIIISLIVLVR